MLNVESSDQLTVVIVSYNRASKLAQLIHLVNLNQVVRAIIVVDNASADESAMAAESSGAEVVRMTVNRGFGAACNAGLERCSTKWVAFCNDDIEPESGAFDLLVQAADTHAAASRRDVAVGPKLLTADGVVAETGHRLPSLRQQVLELLFGERAGRARNILPDSAGGIHTCDWLSAACVVGPAQGFRAVGGFDRAYFMYVEDIDLFGRWRASGRLCAWAPQARVTHRGGRRPVPARLHALCLVNWARYFDRIGGRTQGRVILAAGITGSLLRAGYWGLRGFRSPLARRYCIMFGMGAVRALSGEPRRGGNALVPPAHGGRD